MPLPTRVKIVDVGPRDGLQNEHQTVPAAVKIELVQRLQDAGLKEIEVTSYVSPKWVPQMADNHQVMSGVARASDVMYSVLVPNMKGVEAALADRPDEIVVFGAATEAFSHKNINCSIAESIERFAPVVAAIPSIAADCGIEPDVIEACRATIDRQAGQLQALSAPLPHHG
jgi:hydroxymethylglutaryl-CoA lyase